jgi:hypothetical protein
LGGIVEKDRASGEIGAILKPANARRDVRRMDMYEIKGKRDEGKLE